MKGCAAIFYCSPSMMSTICRILFRSVGESFSSFSVSMEVLILYPFWISSHSSISAVTSSALAFVGWCANECGYIDAGVIPKFASCANGVSWFQQRGQWADKTAEPTPGMIIFFDWDDDSGQDGQSDHVGIVAKVENGRIYTIDGNSGDACKEKSYPVGYYEILGYGVPAY